MARVSITKEDIVSLMEKGYSKGQIANELGVSKSTLTNKFKKYNLSMNNTQFFDLFTKSYLENAFFKDELSFNDVCKKTGCSRTALHRAIKRHGIDYVKNYKSIKLLKDKKWLQEQYISKNKSIKQISLDLNCAEETVSKHIDIHNIDKKPRFKERVWMVDIPIEELSSGRTSKEISEKYPCSEEYVRQLQIRNGIGRQSGSNSSSLERKIIGILDDLDVEYKLNDRSLIHPLEVDIYIPKHKLAIEVNGVYFHNELFVDKEYHKKKRILCSSMGVELIQLYEDDINEKFDIIQNIILYKLGASKKEKIFARKCSITFDVEIEKRRNFLNTNHIQGFAKSDFHVGLEYNGLLVALMLFEGNVLTRYATSKIVCGGFSKLLKNSGKTDVKTFVDYDTFSGKTYEKVGFKLVDYIKPDYKYCWKNKRYHKFNFRKSNFKNNENLLFEDNKTEHELALMNSIYRVYDSGKGVYEWRAQDQEKL